MGMRKILTDKEPALHKTCRPVVEFDNKLHKLLDDMAETLEDANGVGLAAPQVGILRRVVLVDTGDEIRFSTGMGELDRVLGGGAVAGSLVLVGGAPGIGKSTLLLQICNSLCAGRKVLYVSCEESEKQLKLRAQRLSVNPDNLYVLSDTASLAFPSIVFINGLNSISLVINEIPESAIKCSIM